MHVLTLTPFYPTAADEGMGCFVAETVSELERQGVDSSVIAVHPKHHLALAPAAKAPAAQWRSYFSYPGNAGLFIAGSFLHATLRSEVRRLHAKRGIDLIHAHGALPCGHAAMLLARDLKIPFVVTVHGLDAFFTRQVSGWFGRRCAAISSSVYRAVGRVICISEHVARVVQDGVQQAAIVVVYNGVDPKLFAPGAFGPVSDSLILSVGNLIPIKGHELLVRGVAAIVSQHPQIYCEIIGDGPNRSRLQDLAKKLGMESRVHFLGRRSRAEVARRMQASTLFVLPSGYEGLGCVYLEAMSTGRPAIGCRGQGIEEVIRHRENGWLVGPENLNELTAALDTLLRDGELRKKIGYQARETILAGFTLRHQAEALLAVYREALV